MGDGSGVPGQTGGGGQSRVTGVPLWQPRECTALGEHEEGQTRRCGVRQGCRERGSGGAETPPSHLAGLGPVAGASTPFHTVKGGSLRWGVGGR